MAHWLSDHSGGGMRFRIAFQAPGMEGGSGADDDSPDGPEGPDGSGKSADAFRTISEVSDELDVPQHVLRFWETKFSQIRPLKRGGGRRYYRPEDVKLLRRVRHWLYVEGYTIRGVQRLLKEGGAGASPPPPPVMKGESGTARPSQGARERDGDGREAVTAGAKDGAGAPSEPAAGPGKLVLELQGILDELEDLRTTLRTRLDKLP